MLMKGLEHKNFYVPTIPYWWFLIAVNLPGKALGVGVQLWFVYRVGRSKFPVKLSRQWFGLFKCSRHAVRRALQDLAKSGLIQVRQGKGRAPLVTLTLDRKKVADLRKRWAERVYH
jgi:hypothetical protein